MGVYKKEYDMKICLISNIAAHYREEIYSLMDSELDCDFVFGDTLNNGIKTFDTSHFRNKVKILHNFQKGEVTLWQKGVVKELLKNYDAYIISDDIRCFSTWVNMLLSKVLRKKVYYWAHGWYGRERLILKLIKHIFYRLPDGIFLYGNYSRDIMIQNGFNHNKLWVIHNSLSYSRQYAIRTKQNPSNIYKNHFSNSYPTLIYIGRLTAYKKLHMILEAIKLLEDDNLKCNLVLVGDGAEKESLIKKVEVMGLNDKVWFYGACYDEEANAELIYNADLCVSPGNIGLTAIHVMMYGTPAITHNDFRYQGPEYEAILPGKTGDFYEYDDVASLASTISKWLQTYNDKRNAIRKSCFDEIDSYWTPQYQLKVIQDNIQ